MREFVDGLIPAISVMAIALIGLLVARTTFSASAASGTSVLVFFGALALVAVLAGFALYGVGRAQLPHAPVAALRLMRGIAVARITIAVCGTALLMRILVRFVAPPGTSEADKIFNEQLTGALTAFVTAAFVTTTKDSSGLLGDGLIKRAFHAHYDRAEPAKPPKNGVHYFEKVGEKDAPGLLLVHSEDVEGISGWGYTASLKRARRIAEELKKEQSKDTR